MGPQKHTTQRRTPRLFALRYVAIAAAAVLTLGMLPVAARADTATTAPISRLRVIDLAAFANPSQGIRLYVDGVLQASALGFGSTSGYTTLFSGIHHIQIVSGATGTTALDVSPRLLAGRDYSYLIEGRLQGKVFPVLATDNNTPVAAGQARVRFANAIPNGMAVIAHLVGDPTAYRATGFTGVSDYHNVTAGTYALEITSPKGQKLMQLSRVTLAPGQVYTLVATGLTSAATATSMAAAGTLIVSSASGSQIASAPMIAPPAAAVPMAALRLVDLVPATLIAQPLTVVVDGHTYVGAIGFGGTTTYLSIPAGTHRVQIYRTSGGAAVLDSTFSVAANSTSSYILHGLSTGAVSGTLASGDNTPVASTLARVRFSNMAPSGLAVHAVLIGTTPSGAVPFGATALTGFTNYTLVPAGRYILQLFSANNVVLATIPDVTVNSGQIYTFFAVNVTGKPGIAPVLAVSSVGGQLISPVTLPAPAAQPGAPAAPAPVTVQQPASSTTAGLRVLNLVQSMAAQKATFYLDGRLFTSALGFGGSTVFASLPAGQHRLEVFGSTGQVLSNTAVDLKAGSSYTFAVEGTQGGATNWELLPVSMKPVASQAMVRFANAIPGAATLTASFVNVNLRFGSSSFAHVGSYKPVVPGTYELMVRTGSGRVVLTVPHITIEAGKTYTIFATNTAGGTGPVGSAAIVLSA